MSVSSKSVKALRAACVGLIGVSVFGTEALATTFEFFAGPRDESQFQQKEEGLTVTVTGFDETFDPLTGIGALAPIAREVNGIGVLHSPEQGRLAAGEALRFQFSETVQLTELLIHESFRENEFFALFDENNELISRHVVDGEGAGRGDPFSFGDQGLFGSVFTVVGTSPNRNGGGGDNFNPNRGIRVASISVVASDLATVEVAAVPLPAALSLGLTGIAAFAGFRRRSRESIG
ncbi:MAG: VPLPA-CTERM sorting domain-containing protein [Pseudomonadota bacterium]